MSRPSLASAPFGTAPSGAAVDRWTLDSGGGVRAEVLTYGGILHRLWVPDSSGVAACVVLNLPSVGDYAAHSPYFGALIGRYANRIDSGRFTLDGRAHQIPVNDRGHALHGGTDGFDRRIWTARPGTTDRGTHLPSVSVELSLHSPDGDMGFPGALDVTVTYTLDSSGTLAVDYTARTELPTVVSLTNHAYFNLAGAGIGTVLGHTLALDSDRYLPVTASGVPLGPAVATSGTPFDFAEPHPIGDEIAADDAQLHDAGGYDHCWILTPPAVPGELRRAARLAHPESGRRLEVWTTEPGIQVYTGNELDGSLAGSYAGETAKPYERHGAVCLETQHFPDSPNRPAYPTTVLRPDARYTSRTEFRFPSAAGTEQPAAHSRGQE
ncbi:aldose epimerase family protein [Streptomyces sp. NBC_00370]|uniref:aldose epimerase family protein n=1 Tax=Streptomyces sp. NBC_00370 TaxID=2975728 RepID=UPI002E25A662